MAAQSDTAGRSFLALSRLFARQLQAWDALSRGHEHLVRPFDQHKSKAVSGFTAQYGVDRLVWYECHDDPRVAIARETDIKKWRRDWKIRLIEENNPDWRDLYDAIAR
jgi:putative endonuclease